MLTFIELHPFAIIRDKYLTDNEFADLQHDLATHPGAGDTIPGSGGCRKLRWAPEGCGKRGGLRGGVVFVTMCAKNFRDNIEPGLLRRLKEAFEHGKAF